MAIGPVQLFALGFPAEGANVTSKIDQAIKDSPWGRGTAKEGEIRLLDLVVIRKDAQGNIDRLRATDLTPEQRKFAGAAVGSLIGMGAGAQSGRPAGRLRGTMEGAKIGAQPDGERQACWRDTPGRGHRDAGHARGDWDGARRRRTSGQPERYVLTVRRIVVLALARGRAPASFPSPLCPAQLPGSACGAGAVAANPLWCGACSPSGQQDAAPRTDHRCDVRDVR
jgi:hypothetical protein